MTSSGQAQAGVMLHSRPYRENSLIIDWLTPNSGRVATVYKGARQRRRSTVPSLFNSYRIRFTGRSALATLTEAELETHRWLSGDATVVGLYANELIVRLLAERDPHPKLFAAYCALLDLLLSSASGPDVEAGLRRFELLLLADIGYAIELAREATTGELIAPDKSYRFDPENGFTETDGQSDAADVFSGTLLAALDRSEPLDPVQRRDAKRLLRQALKPHLNGKPLRATELWLRSNPDRSPESGATAEKGS